MGFKENDSTQFKCDGLVGSSKNRVVKKKNEKKVLTVTSCRQRIVDIVLAHLRVNRTLVHYNRWQHVMLVDSPAKNESPPNH